MDIVYLVFASCCDCRFWWLRLVPLSSFIVLRKTGHRVWCILLFGEFQVVAILGLVLFAVCSLQCAVCSLQFAGVGWWLVALGRALTVSWAPQRRESCHCSSELSPVSQSWKRARRGVPRRERVSSFGELKSRGEQQKRRCRSYNWGKRKLGGR